MTREENWLRLGVEIHYERNNGCGKVSTHVVGDVALPVVFIDFSNAIGILLFVFEIIVAKLMRIERKKEGDVDDNRQIGIVILSSLIMTYEFNMIG